MFIVEGTYNGKNLKKGTFVDISNSRLTISNVMSTNSDSGIFDVGTDGDGQLWAPALQNEVNKSPVQQNEANKSVTVKLEKVISVDVISQESKTTTGGGTTGAAAGAVLGFLVAGPVGTAVGAGLGSKKKVEGIDNTTISIGFSNGDLWICEIVSNSDIAKLKVAAAKNKRTPIQQNKISNPDSKSKKTKSHQQKKVLNKPKRPDGMVLVIPEHFNIPKNDSPTELPNLDFLQKWEKIEGVDSIAWELFSSPIKGEVERYNNFLWEYFDTKIEIEKEYDQIAIRILRNLIAQTNGLNSAKDRISSLDAESKKLEDQLQILTSKLDNCKKELSETGFFGNKGDIKVKITTTEIEINKIKSQISKNNRISTSNQKKYDSKASKVLRNIDNPLKQFELMFDTIFPEEKKPKTGLKAMKKLDESFFFETYTLYFDEIWDKKIQEDKEQRKKEKRLKDNQDKENKEKEETEELKLKSKEKIDKSKHESSIKDRLTELQALKDSNLITDEEFEISRKKIISSL